MYNKNRKWRNHKIWFAKIDMKKHIAIGQIYRCVFFMGKFTNLYFPPYFKYINLTFLLKNIVIFDKV